MLTNSWRHTVTSHTHTHTYTHTHDRAHKHARTHTHTHTLRLVFVRCKIFFGFYEWENIKGYLITHVSALTRWAHVHIYIDALRKAQIRTSVGSTNISNFTAYITAHVTRDRTSSTNCDDSGKRSVNWTMLGVNVAGGLDLRWPQAPLEIVISKEK